MNESLLRGAVAISGVGTAGCGDASGFTDMEILAKAARSAVHDAGLKMSDIDGIATANLSAALWPLNVVEYLNVRPSYVDGTNIGGTSFIGHMLPAARALMSGAHRNFKRSVESLESPTQPWVGSRCLPGWLGTGAWAVALSGFGPP